MTRYAVVGLCRKAQPLESPNPRDR